MLTLTRTPLALVLLVLAGSAYAGPSDPARDLKSGDVPARLKAVETLRKRGGEDAEALLLEAVKDADWEVVERAAEALAAHGGKKSVKALAALATKGRVRGVRLAAATSLATLDSEDAAKRLAKALRKDAAAHAAAALSVIAQETPSPDGEQLRKAAEKAVKAKEASVRAAATGILRAFPEEERVDRFRRFLADPDLGVVGAALDHLRANPDAIYLPPVVSLLGDASHIDVVARRVIAAIEAVTPLLDDRAAAAEVVAPIESLLGKKPAPVVAARVATLLGRLAAAPPAPPEDEADEEVPPAEEGTEEATGEGEDDAPEPAEEAAPPPRILAAETALRLLELVLAREDEGARAAAVRALGRVGTPEAIERAIACLADKHPRVRLQALRAMVDARGLEDEATLGRVAALLAEDEAPVIREEAALLLGRSLPESKPFDAPVPALTKALDDEEWSVALVAAVSLGKTRSPEAVKPLAARLNRKTTKDWRLRGAAAVGLGNLRRKEAVPHLIQALKDKDAFVRRSAYEFLLRMTKSFMPAEHDQWAAWWEYVGPKYAFEDREKLARELKRGGYAVDPVDVYDKIGSASMDIVVLQSRGDHIEKLLEELEIPVRITRAASVPSSELHSFAVFVSNCTGEVQQNDIERLQWFVRVGGYLFCSCWALRHTVEPVYPGLVRKHPTKGEVLDNVLAEPVPRETPFLDGVFRPWTRPIYVLYGSHLIEVLQPERVEVLIDSPDCATRWGNGNLACWFPVGHGVILDSANHFDLQGLERVTGLRTAEDRMAYAMDHMGLDYPTMRKLAAEGVWGRQSEAVKRVRDLSAFRFITNFVRVKRRTEP